MSFPKTELPAGGRRLVMLGPREVAVFNVDGTLYALFNRCAHHQAPLIAGELGGTNVRSDAGQLVRGLDGRVLRCPWHHYEFDLATGRCIADTRLRVATYEVHEEGEEIAVYG